MALFKAYDIRGIYGTELTEEIAFNIGRAFVDFLNCKKLVIGNDMRVSAKTLVESFIKGAVKQGCDVVNIGLVSTDCLYFASGKLNLPGVIFTASHNPPEYNGLKLCKEGAAPINYDNGLKFIKEIIDNKKYKEISEELQGTVYEIDIISDFVKHVQSFIDFKKLKNLKIAADAGNGMAGKMIPEIFSYSNVNILPMYFELDGSFPNHLADPSKRENLKDLQKKVLEEKCDFGMAFDGDADRVFFVDENAQIVDSSLMSCLIIDNLLKKSPNEKVIYNLVCSKRVPEIITEKGGTPIKERVGHSYIKETMKETNSVFACEHSAHYYYRDNFRADSGIITSVIISEILSQTEKKLSALIKDYMKYYKIEETNVKVSDKEKKLSEIKEKFEGSAKISEIDGVTVEFDDWWFNVRPSNTEPLLRLNLEADTEELKKTKKEEVLDILKN